MARLTDESALLRMAIAEVLASATEPMTSTAIAEKPSVFELGATSVDVSQLLRKLYLAKTKPFPLARTPAYACKGAGRGAARWDYYNPAVVKMAPSPSLVKALAERICSQEAPPVNAVNPPEFQFDPVAFEAPPSEDAPVVVPAGVKTITLTVGGVSIKIEIGGAS